MMVMAAVRSWWWRRMEGRSVLDVRVGAGWGMLLMVHLGNSEEWMAVGNGGRGESSYCIARRGRNRRLCGLLHWRLPVILPPRQDIMLLSHSIKLPLASPPTTLLSHSPSLSLFLFLSPLHSSHLILARISGNSLIRPDASNLVLFLVLCVCLCVFDVGIRDCVWRSHSKSTNKAR